MQAWIRTVVRSRWLARGAVAAASLGLLLFVVVGTYGAYLATFLELPRREDHPPLRLYTAPFQLKPDLSVKESRLSERMQCLGYRAVPGEGRSPGE